MIRRPFERDAGTHMGDSLVRHIPATSAVIPAKAGIHEEQSGGAIAGSDVPSAFTRTWYGPVNLFGTRNGSET